VAGYEVEPRGADAGGKSLEALGARSEAWDGMNLGALDARGEAPVTHSEAPGAHSEAPDARSEAFRGEARWAHGSHNGDGQDRGKIRAAVKVIVLRWDGTPAHRSRVCAHNHRFQVRSVAEGMRLRCWGTQVQGTGTYHGLRA
jgi:hypothetical protein